MAFCDNNIRNLDKETKTALQILQNRNRIHNLSTRKTFYILWYNLYILQNGFQFWRTDNQLSVLYIFMRPSISIVKLHCIVMGYTYFTRIEFGHNMPYRSAPLPFVFSNFCCMEENRTNVRLLSLIVLPSIFPTVISLSLNPKISFCGLCGWWFVSQTSESRSTICMPKRIFIFLQFVP